MAKKIILGSGLDYLINTKINSLLPQDITTGGAAVKCGYKIDGKDVYVARRSFNSGSAVSQASASINLTGLGVNKIIDIRGTVSDNMILGSDSQGITYTTSTIVIWFNNSNSATYTGSINIYFTKA